MKTNISRFVKKDYYSTNWYERKQKSHDTYDKYKHGFAINLNVPVFNSSYTQIANHDRNTIKEQQVQLKRKYVNLEIC